MRKLTTFLLICLLVFIPGCSAEAATYSVEFNGVNYTYQDIPKLETAVSDQIQIMNVANTMAESARTLGYAEDHSIILLAKEEYKTAQGLMIGYNKVIYDLTIEFENRWAEQEKEYPNATYVWKFLKQQGYNDYVCAGILGNMMAEVGGQTLNIKPFAINPSGYYGICQWNKNHVNVWSKDLVGQCDYLEQTIESEFNTYGSKYKKGFNYEAFCELKDEGKAALAFAKSYERCSSKSYKQREKNAKVAYEYFVK